MKLMEALRLARAPADAEPFPVFLACGFTPLHLTSFLAAHLRRLHPRLAPAVSVGLYGDVPGSLIRIGEQQPAAAAVLLEWADLDPRLGRRSAAGVALADLPDVVAGVQERAELLLARLGAAAERVPIALCPPTLPLPTVSATAGWQAHGFELRMQAELAGLLATAAEMPNVRVLASRRLDRVSPPGARLDPRSEFLSDFPYRLEHASALAEQLAALLAPPPPLKGLITDLDDTLWRGLLGEVGVAGVHWNLDGHSQVHALYQQLLRRLSEAGVLLAVASKNDGELVRVALSREDLIVSEAHFFPVEAHWSPKSESVARILRAWNIGADAVVFVDDSPLELAEVGEAFPDLPCLRFPTDDEGAALELMEQLQDRFGKSAVRAEDALRAVSLRADQEFRRASGPSPSDGGDGTDTFLSRAEAHVVLEFSTDPTDGRALELVNKTNQFNLNGRRYTEGAWRDELTKVGSFLLTVTYQDRFGPLGKIAVLTGRCDGPEVRVTSWVMSCRAFARRIEHRCVEALFRRFATDQLVLEYAATPRNGPLQEFLTPYLGDATASECVVLRRDDFDRHCPPLFHQVEVR